MTGLPTVNKHLHLFLLSTLYTAKPIVYHIIGTLFVSKVLFPFVPWLSIISTSCSQYHVLLQSHYSQSSNNMFCVPVPLVSLECNTTYYCLLLVQQKVSLNVQSEWQWQLQWPIKPDCQLTLSRKQRPTSSGQSVYASNSRRNVLREQTNKQV